MNRVPMTMAGIEKLRAELKELESTERRAVINAIAEARRHGDLKENAEYHAARERQSFIEGRIKELQAKLSSAQVIDITRIQKTGRVIFGATVTLYNSTVEEEVCYQIVGEDEADINVNKISVTSPIARGIIGKHEGDVADVETPSGVVEYEIIQVDHL